MRNDDVTTYILLFVAQTYQIIHLFVYNMSLYKILTSVQGLEIKKNSSHSLVGFIVLRVAV